MSRKICLLGWYVFCAIGIGLFFEMALPRWLMPYLPPHYVMLFDRPEGVWPLMQTSKRSAVPQERYWALLGDSYAKGMGDAQMDLQAVPRAYGYGAAHAMYEKTGRDIVTFAAPGSGSLRGLVANYAGAVHFLRAQNLDWPRSPELMIYFFYEGNDLVENILYERKLMQGSSESDTEDVLQLVLSRDELYSAIEAGSRAFLFSQLLHNMFAILAGEQHESALGAENQQGEDYIPIKRWLPRMQGKSLNKALIAGEEVVLPGNLQGPSLELSEDQLAQSLDQFTLALQINREQWPETPLIVVYIPSVLSCYQLLGTRVEAQNFLADDTIKAPIAEVVQRHLLIKREIAERTQQLSLTFLDASAPLIGGCGQQAIHGPKDWNHLNKQGYSLLGNWLAEQIPAVFSLKTSNSPKK